MVYAQSHSSPTFPMSSLSWSDVVLLSLVILSPDKLRQKSAVTSLKRTMYVDNVHSTCLYVNTSVCVHLDVSCVHNVHSTCLYVNTSVCVHFDVSCVQNVHSTCLYVNTSVCVHLGVSCLYTMYTLHVCM